MVGPPAGPYTVTVDNRAVGTFNATRSRFSPRTLLYQESGLGQGEHTVGVSNLPYLLDGQTIYIDYAVVWGPS